MSSKIIGSTERTPVTYKDVAKIYDVLSVLGYIYCPEDLWLDTYSKSQEKIDAFEVLRREKTQIDRQLRLRTLIMEYERLGYTITSLSSKPIFYYDTIWAEKENSFINLSHFL